MFSFTNMTLKTHTLKKQNFTLFQSSDWQLLRKDCISSSDKDAGEMSMRMDVLISLNFIK